VNKRLIVGSLLVMLTQTSFGINFGGIGGRLGNEIEKLNPFSLNTPEKRSEDFYQNSGKKEFDCRFGSRWMTLSDGYLMVNNQVAIGEVKKLTKNRQLLVLVVNTGRNLVCTVDDRDWSIDGVGELSGCLINDSPILMCKRKSN
jgi:hypothetical protein